MSPHVPSARKTISLLQQLIFNSPSQRKAPKRIMFGEDNSIKYSALLQHMPLFTNLEQREQNKLLMNSVVSMQRDTKYILKHSSSGNTFFTIATAIKSFLEIEVASNAAEKKHTTKQESKIFTYICFSIFMLLTHWRDPKCTLRQKSKKMYDEFCLQWGF